MKYKSRLLCFSTFILLAGTGSVYAQSTPALAELPIPQDFGVNIHFQDEQLPSHIDYLKKAGIAWVRRDIDWNEVESTKGTYNFTKYDHIIDALHGAGIKIAAIIDYNNTHYDDGNSPVSAEARAAYARFAVAAVKRFAGKVDVWEIYNEPNIGFWKPKPDVQQYVAMANEATAAIRKAAPGTIIVGPALSGPFLHDPFVGKVWPTYAFLDQVLASDAAHSWNAITIHPYRSPKDAPETAAAQIDNVRSMMRDHGIDPQKIPVIAGEWGYSTFAQGVSEDMQAAYAVREFLFAGIEHMPYTIWYDWQDDGRDNQNQEHRFGLLHIGTLWDGEWASRSIKPAFQAIQQLSGLLKGYRFDALLENDSSVMVVRYLKGGQAAYAAWSVDNAPHTANVDLTFGKWRLNHILGDEKDLTATSSQPASIAVDKTPVIITPAG